MIVGFARFQTRPLLVTHTQVLEGHACPQLIDSNNPSSSREPKQMGLLFIDDGVRTGDVGLECPHLRRVKREPQSQFAVANRSFRFFQVRDIDDSADRANGLSPVDRIAIVAASVDGHPSCASVGANNAMHPVPSSVTLRVASRHHARKHLSPVVFMEK